MKSFFSYLLLAVLVLAAAGASAQEDCAYLPEFKALRAQLDGMPAAKVVKALEDYSAE